MTYPISKQDQVMSEEQFTQVVEAILDGKYSWACVLILRFAGYNPLHYIPYRTYNRLMKDNQHKQKSITAKSINKTHELKKSDKIQDLSFVEPLTHSSAAPRGGSHSIYHGFIHCMKYYWKLM